MSSNWLIGVMLTPPGESAPVRHFFAAGGVDRAKAEWTSIDRAQLIGRVAESPVGGLEPVHMVAELTAPTVRKLALRIGEVRSLGWQWPRRWIAV